MQDKKPTIDHDEVVTVDGFRFRVRYERDDDMGPPWKENDGNGIVSEWTRRDKRPGEIVLCEGGGNKRFYDVQETMKIAKRDGWGLSDDARGLLAGKLGRAPTPGEITAAAVRLDFEYLRGWCNDDWHWTVVFVERVDSDDAVMTYDCLGAVESHGDYKSECAWEMIENLLAMAKKEQAETAEAARRAAEEQAELERIATGILVYLNNGARPDLVTDFARICAKAGIAQT